MNRLALFFLFVFVAFLLDPAAGLGPRGGVRGVEERGRALKEDKGEDKGDKARKEEEPKTDVAPDDKGKEEKKDGKRRD